MFVPSPFGDGAWGLADIHIDGYMVSGYQSSQSSALGVALIRVVTGSGSLGLYLLFFLLSFRFGPSLFLFLWLADNVARWVWYHRHGFRSSPESDARRCRVLF